MLVKSFANSTGHFCASSYKYKQIKVLCTVYCHWMSVLFVYNISVLVCIGCICRLQCLMYMLPTQTNNYTQNISHIKTSSDYSVNKTVISINLQKILTFLQHQIIIVIIFLNCIFLNFLSCMVVYWLGHWTGNLERSQPRGFDSQQIHYYIMTQGKLYTHMFLCHQAV